MDSRGHFQVYFAKLSDLAGKSVHDLLTGSWIWCGRNLSGGQPSSKKASGWCPGGREQGPFQRGKHSMWSLGDNLHPVTLKLACWKTATEKLRFRLDMVRFLSDLPRQKQMPELCHLQHTATCYFAPNI